VVIVFHNEARSTLLRTIVSLYKRTPPKYLYEIIVIDDFSDDGKTENQKKVMRFQDNIFTESLLTELARLNFPPFNLNKTQLNNKVESENANAFTTIKMQRNPHRLGLIESRNRGAILAKGDYLFFLDSHCEVNIGWLEPLLARASVNMVAVSPVLDTIDTNTLTYRSGSTSLMGAFDWNLHFHWLPRKLQKQTKDYKTKTKPFK